MVTQGQRADSLNDAAYRWRYRDIDSLHVCAMQALKEARRTGNHDAEAEALNLLLFERFQQMDFDSALVIAEQVRHLTTNQIELLIADVMTMKVAQRISDNLAFFTYRMHAGRRLQRIAEEEDLLTPHQLVRLNFARGEFYIVSATYFYYVNQHERALAEINQAEPFCQLPADTAQWLYFCYMKGSGDMTEDSIPELVTRTEFDYLFKCFTFSKNNGYRFFQANALQSLAVMMNDTLQRRFIQSYKPDAIEYLKLQFSADTMPQRMALRAYELFYEYRDRFQSACALRTLGELSFYERDAMQAISYYKQALLLVEGKHLPEWISGFHQHMSLAYSALGNREASAKHRNAYLDNLAVTQQDMEQASRYASLQAENGRLTWTLMGLIALAVGLILLFIFLQWRMRKNARAQEWLLHQVLLLSEAEDSSVETADKASSDADVSTGANASKGAIRSLEALAAPYRAFMTSAHQQVQLLEDEREQLEEAQAAAHLRIVSGKRQNIEKRAKLQLVYAIVPFLDRVIGEVNRMESRAQVNAESLDYICELIDKINDYNDILTQWIQMQQGQLSLRITTFSLGELFSMIRQSHYAFDQNGIRLDVADTDVVVKADRALTLFMLNTLADNARKFTANGGQVTITASSGSAPEGEYVEVSVSDTGVGLSAEDVDTILNNKVFDASALGCHDQQKPSSASVSQTEGNKGFGFGLMNCKGIIEKYRKTGARFGVCQFGVESRLGQGSRFFFRLPRVLTMFVMAFSLCGLLFAQTPDAYRLMDSVYFANVGQRYNRAISYADSVLASMNAYHQTLPGAEASMMLLSDSTDAVPADYLWWQSQDSIDFSLVLGLRNEIAVAALGLQDWPLYRYNNRIYTHLYKLCSQDTSIEAYCQSLERTHANRRIAIAIIIVLLFAGVVSAYFLYIRPRLLFRLDISQLLHLNQRLLALATSNDTDSDTLSQALLSEALTGINGIHYVKDVSLDADGSLHFDYGDEHPTSNQRTLDRLLSRYVYLILNERIMRQNRSAFSLELAEDEHRRSLYEESQLHVQNQIMDNCLSTIKHESMYYPSRIRHLAERMKDADGGVDGTLLPLLSETVAYYKQIYTLLSEQAREQSGTIRFRRQVVDVATLPVEQPDAPLAVRGDADLLTYLIDLLTHELGATSTHVDVDTDTRFVRFTVVGSELHLSDDALHDLFSPRPDGIPFLLCKQIVREHDTFLGHPGCRINAEQAPGGGTQVWFTVPRQLPSY